MSYEATEANIAPMGIEDEKALRLCELFEQDLKHQINWRNKQAARDERYYHGEQRTAEEIAELDDKDRAPIEINEIAPQVDSILSDALDVDFDWEIVPILGMAGASDEEELAAQAYTCLMDEAKTRSGIEFNQDDVKEDGLLVGRGWIEMTVEKKVIKLLHAPWRDMWWDCFAQDKYTLSDARHVERAKWVPYTWALKKWPKAAAQLRSLYDESGDESGDAGNNQFPATRDYELSVNEAGQERPKYVDKKNKRIRIVEMWYFDDSDLVRKAIFTKKTMFQDDPTPLKVNILPFRSYTVKVDHKGMPYGLVRPLVDLQDVINKRYSKAEFLLDVCQIFYQEGGLTDVDTLLKLVAQPDAAIPMPAGSEYGKTFFVQRGGELSQQQYAMFVDAITRMREVGGRNRESMGQQTNARSGSAIGKRQQAAANVVYKAFRNIKRFWFELGLATKQFVEAYYDDARLLRVTNDENVARHISFNGPGDALQLQGAGGKFDLKMTTIAASRDAREREQEKMQNLAKTLGPNFFPAELWIKNSGMRDKPQLIKQVREMREAQSQPTPEQQAKAQKAQAEAQAIMVKAGLSQAQIQEVMAKAGLAKAQTEGQQIENSLMLEKLEALDKGVASIKTWIEGQPKAEGGDSDGKA